jgi:PAS domain S-box-containing protein
MFISKVATLFSDEDFRPFRIGIGDTSGVEDSDGGSDNIRPTFTGPAPTGEFLNEINTQLILNAHEGVIVYDQYLKYALWNPFMEEMTGLRSHDVLGKHHSGLFPFVKEQGLDRLIESALVGECVSTPDFTFYVPGSGKSGWASANYGPLRDWKGEIVGVLATVKDLTKHKLAEEARGQSEERYRNVVEKATDLMYMLSMDGTIIALNQAFEAVTGWSRTEWIGKSVLGFVHPEDLPLASGLIRRVFRGEAVPTFELRFRSKSGEYLIGECTIAAQTENGRVVAASGMVRDVTARKHAEEALRQAESDYRSIFENALDGMFRSTPDGRFVLVNPALVQMLGYDSPEELIESVGSSGHHFYADPQRREEYGRLMNELGVVERFENQVRRKDGRFIYISENGRAVRGSDGELLYYEGTIKDITERRGAVEALRQSEEKYRELVENINDIVYTSDDRGTITYVSPVVELITGYRPSEMTGRSMVEFVHPEDLPPFMESFNETIAGTLEPLEYRIVAKSGDVRWVRSSSRQVFDGGRVVGLRGVIADITERKRVEAHLELLATAVEQAGESILITGTDGTIQYVNPAFEQTTGYSQTEIVGQTPHILNSGRHDPAFYRELWDTIVRGDVWTGRFINRKKDGTLFEEEATISPVRDTCDRIVNFVAVKRDVTKEVELEKQLLHSQKMEAVGRLAGGVAHDFNNLLTAIIGYSQLVKGKLGPGHRLGTEVDQILDAGHRAAALTSQLLAFSRRQTLIPRNINLNDTIGNLMKMLRRIIGEDVDLRYQASQDLYPVFADAGQIEQVIMNMAVNARDAMPGGGRLTIETSNVTLDEAYCREHLWARPGEYARISVSDSGAGMDPETRRRIFEPFFTTKEIGKGTGLGLAVVYGIVKQHGGLIHVYSEPGHGTTFKLYLKAQVAAPQYEVPKPQTALRGGSETILVAEDEETLRELARTILGGLGYRVLLASNGEEAVLICEAAMNEIDLVILDLIMPRMGGREACERMRELGGHFPVIFMTGYAPDMVEDQLPEMSTRLLIQKPYAVDVLARRVRDVLDAHVARSDEPLN